MLFCDFVLEGNHLLLRNAKIRALSRRKLNLGSSSMNGTLEVISYQTSLGGELGGKMSRRYLGVTYFF